MKDNFSIPNQINLIYTPHAMEEQWSDKLGKIDCVPRQFIKKGCKSFEPDKKGIPYIFLARYIFDDNKDLILIIDGEYGKVITNYLVYAHNLGVYKGRYRIKSFITEKTKNFHQK